MSPVLCKTSLMTFIVILFSLISHGAGMRFTQQDYESRSYTALLKGIREFSIEKAEMLSKLPSEDLPLDGVTDLKKCSCKGTTCGCCMHVKVEKIDLDSDVCIQVSYLPREIGVQVALTVDGKNVFTKKVSVRNPPAICAGVPGLKKLASLCIKFSDLKISGKQLSGCVELQARLAKVMVETFNIGCFKVPPKIEIIGNDELSSVETMGSTDAFDMDTGDLPLELLSDNVAIGAIEDLKGCSCHADMCGCCLNVKMNKIHLHANVCVSVGYLPSEMGVEAELTVNGKVLFIKKVSVHDPPAICVPIPDFPVASICIHLYNLNIHSSYLSGCIDLEGRLYKITVEKISLGCYQMPILQRNSSPEVQLLDGSNGFEIKNLDLPKEIQQVDQLILETSQESSGKKCSCQQDSCQCCAHVRHGGDACFKASLLPKEVGFQAELSVNGKTILKEKVTTPSPPPICKSVSKQASLCLIFKNLHVADKKVEGCVEIDARMSGRSVGKIDLGCFNISPKNHEMSFENNLFEVNNEDVIEQLPSPMNLKQSYKFSFEFIQESSSKTCTCHQESCQCCADLKVDKLHMNFQVCFKASFLPKEIGFQAEVTVAGKSIFKKKVTAQNPPPICGTLKESTQVCLVFKNLHISGKQLQGCVEADVRMATVTVGKVSLGCFTIPPRKFDERFETLKQLAPALIQTLMKASVGDEEALPASNNAEEFVQLKKCQGDKDSYSCCIDFPILGKKRTVCLRVVFLQSALGVDLQVLYDGKVIFHQEVHVKDPPPFCVPLPFGKSKAISVCLKLKNLQLHTDFVSGCLEVDAKIEKVTVKKFDLGCFRVPPKVEFEDSNSIAADQEYLN